MMQNPCLWPWDFELNIGPGKFDVGLAAGPYLLILELCVDHKCKVIMWRIDVQQSLLVISCHVCVRVIFLWIRTKISFSMHD